MNKLTHPTASLTLHVEGLSIGYRHRKATYTVAQHITADIRSGELTCLIGTNGIGKSTLLRTLSGFQLPLEGDLKLNGQSIADYTDRQLSRLISVVLTEKCNIPNLTVTELIGLGRSPYTGFWGVLSEHDRCMVQQAIVTVGIEKLARRTVQTLSDGERQKAMIAKALAQETPVILLDEPTAFLDYPSKVELMQLLHRLSHEGGKTIFLSTHDLELALQVADSLWLMQPGGYVVVGTPEDLTWEGQLQACFLHKGWEFNAETGQIRVNFPFYRTLRVVGDGPRIQLLRKALQRQGIQAITEGSSMPCIKVTADGYHLHRTETDNCVYTHIRDVLEILKSSF